MSQEAARAALGAHVLTNGDKEAFRALSTRVALESEAYPVGAVILWRDTKRAMQTGELPPDLRQARP